jgi:BASS family bile acid:Na+ symporter
LEEVRVKKFCNFVVQNMAVFVVLIAVVAVLEPWTLTWVAPRVAWMLGIVMFGMGMTLKVEDFKTICQRPRDVGIGVLCQFIIMPGTAWLLVKVFRLPPELAIGVILVGTCPGGTASNVITYLAKGDVALSVAMTTCTTLLAPVVTPVLTWLLADTWINVSITAMMLSIAQMVLLPIILGLTINHYLPGLVHKLLPVLPFISVVTIVLLVGGVVAMSGAKLLQMGLLVAVVVICHNLLGLLLVTWPPAGSSCRKPRSGLSPLKWACKIPVWPRPWPSCISSRRPPFPALSSASGTIFPGPCWPTIACVKTRRAKVKLNL